VYDIRVYLLSKFSSFLKESTTTSLFKFSKSEIAPSFLSDETSSLRFDAPKRLGLVELISSQHDILDIHEFDYKENSQANATINSKYKINYSEKNKEYLILSKPK